MNKTDSKPSLADNSMPLTSEESSARLSFINDEISIEKINFTDKRAENRLGFNISMPTTSEEYRQRLAV